MTGKNKVEIEKKLHEIVLKHLKIEEAKEKAEEAKWDNLTEEEIEKENKKVKDKEDKKAAKKKKNEDDD